MRVFVPTRRASGSIVIQDEVRTGEGPELRTVLHSYTYDEAIALAKRIVQAAEQSRLGAVPELDVERARRNAA